jgi:hypothetical protein
MMNHCSPDARLNRYGGAKKRVGRRDEHPATLHGSAKATPHPPRRRCTVASHCATVTTATATTCCSLGQPFDTSAAQPTQGERSSGRNELLQSQRSLRGQRQRQPRCLPKHVVCDGLSVGLPSSAQPTKSNQIKPNPACAQAATSGRCSSTPMQFRRNASNISKVHIGAV